MSLDNPECTNKICEFCDSNETMYGYYFQDAVEKGMRIPGLIDETN